VKKHTNLFYETRQKLKAYTTDSSVYPCQCISNQISVIFGSMQGSRRNKIHLQYCRGADLYTLARIYFINLVMCIFIIIERDTVRRVAASALLNLVGSAYQLLLPLAAFRCDVIRANKI